MAGTRKNGILWDDISKLLEEVMTDRWSCSEQAAFFKISGPQGHRVYIARSATVRRIDLTFDPNFGIPEVDGAPVFKGIIPIRKSNGSAIKEVDTNCEGAFDNLRSVFVWMNTAAPQVAEKKSAFVPKLPNSIAQRRVATAESPEEKIKRAKLIKDFARERGVAISPNANIGDEVD
jgi:hypothetical protein